MSKAKELFIIGATAASCAIGYAFYKNNENNQDQQKEKMKQSLIQSTSSAMDMREHGSDSLHGPARNSVMANMEPGDDSSGKRRGQDFKRTDDVGQDFGTRMIGPKTDDVKGQDFGTRMVGPKTDSLGGLGGGKN